MKLPGNSLKTIEEKENKFAWLFRKIKRFAVKFCDVNLRLAHPCVLMGLIQINEGVQTVVPHPEHVQFHRTRSIEKRAQHENRILDLSLGAVVKASNIAFIKDGSQLRQFYQESVFGIPLSLVEEKPDSNAAGNNRSDNGTEQGKENLLIHAGGLAIHCIILFFAGCVGAALGLWIVTRKIVLNFLNRMA